MKKKILCISLIMLASLIAFSFNGVMAYSWNGKPEDGSMTLNVLYGESSSGTEVITLQYATNRKTTGRFYCGCENHMGWSIDKNGTSTYIVKSVDGNSITVDTLQVGTREIYVNTHNTSGCGVTWSDTVPVYVVCNYSSNLRTFIKNLGGTTTETSIESNNLYVDYSSEEKIDAIIDNYELYNSLTAKEKELVNSLISARSGGVYSSYIALYNATDNQITSLANTFIQQELENNVIASKSNYATIVDSETIHNNLYAKVKGRVDSRIKTLSNQSTTSYTTLLDYAKAYQFIVKYDIDKTFSQLTKTIDEKILSSQTEWTKLGATDEETSRIQNAVVNIIGQSYSEWMAAVQDNLDQRNAEEFVNRNNLSNFDLSKFEVVDYIDVVNEGNEKLAETILGSVSTDYNKLNEIAKSKTATSTDMGCSFETISESAQNYLDAISARSFINNNKLKTKFPASVDELSKDDLNELEKIATKIVGLSERFSELNAGAQGKVNSELGVNSFEVIINNAQSFLDDVNSAKEFINSNKLNQTMTAEIAEKVMDLYEEDAFEGLTDRAQSMVDVILGKTFKSLVNEAEKFIYDVASKFISDNKLMSVVSSKIGKQMIGSRMYMARIAPEEYEALNKDIAKNVLTLDDDFEGLSPRVQNIVLEMLGVSEAGGFETVRDIAQEYLDETEANEFVEDNKLKEELTKQIASNIVKLEDKFNNLSNDNVKEKVLAKLDVENFNEVIKDAQEYLDTVAAKEFYNNYLEGLDEEKIASGKDTWNNSSKVVQNKINKLLNDNGVKETYPELLNKAIDVLNDKAAQEFINNYLTKDSEVIKEANASNAKQIIEAEEAYDLLSDEVKEKVNAKLNEISNTTYPELLKAAQELQKNPKTGDLSRIMMVLFVGSIIGIVATRKKRK